MLLAELLPEFAGAPPVMIAGMTEDSREVAPGDAFVAVAGEVSDGHAFAAAAVARGAVAVLAERPVELADAGGAVPVVVVPALKSRRGELAARLYGDPSRHLYCVGTTGTNGKTSIACYISDLANRLGMRAGYMGTIGWGQPGRLEQAQLTTADAITIQRRLASLRADGCRWAVLEASSHALAQGRVSAVAFRAAVFSNLSRDHLDYHESFAAYGEAKARLFGGPDIETAVINADDPFGRELIERLSGRANVIGYGRAAAVSWRALEFGRNGITGEWLTPWGRADLKLPLYGEFSVANMSAALAVLCAAGQPLVDVAEAAQHVCPVPGRMEFFRGPDRPTVVVDFAHTPDALEQVLVALRRHVTGRLVCVFGCGGDRDQGKRPQMARAAELHADELWLTSDNPRTEQPAAIIADMVAGLAQPRRAQRRVDREQAIREAIAGAGAADLILVAGKGHEDYQEVNGRRAPFSDRTLVASILESTEDESSCCSG